MAGDHLRRDRPVDHYFEKEKMSNFVEKELKELEERVKDISFTELITCHPSMVQVKVRHTEHKQLTICAQFPEDYPNRTLLLELKSKTIPDKLIEGLVRVCEQELEKHKNSRQILVLVKFINEFVVSNPFMVCSDELSFIKKELVREGDELKVKQKLGTIHYKAYQGRYFIDFVLSVPNEYPSQHVKLELKLTNFPTDFKAIFTGRASEMMRQCVEPPLRRKPSDPPFQPKPSLQVVANYLVTECTRKFPLEECVVCSKPALPEDPKDIVTDESHDMFVYRVYCSHMYHRHCLDVYTKTPPFEGGKKCPKCRQRIFHDKWNVHPRLAEERWAHQEARKREVAEVADFLGF